MSNSNIILYDRDNQIYSIPITRNDDKNFECHFHIDDETNLIFYGESKNGFAQGYGKYIYNYYYGEFFESYTEYVGNFKRGKKEGQGILYHSNIWYKDDDIVSHRKKYEGEWKNNKIQGKGILYFISGEKKYEGNFLEGKPHNKGISYYDNGNKEYEGNWENGNKSGKGTEYYENGSIKSKGRYIQGKWFDETSSFLQKYLETRDSSILKKVTAKEIQSYIEKNFMQTFPSQKRKSFLICELEKLSDKKKKEIIIDDFDYDEFGNEIQTQCLGTDGNIYDISSMYYLFEKNENGEYKNIPYKYKNNERVPNFPRMGNGQILNGFEILLN